MSGSSERDSQSGQGPSRVAAVIAQRGGEVDRPRAAKHADDQVAQAGHDLRAAASAQLRGVLGKGHVADPVQAVLDRPVSPDEVGGQCCIWSVRGRLKWRQGLVSGHQGQLGEYDGQPPVHRLLDCEFVVSAS